MIFGSTCAITMRSPLLAPEARHTGWAKFVVKAAKENYQN